MKKLAKFSYLIALISIAILISWCVCAVIINVFNLKIFQENTSQFAVMAILPILATVAGASMINIVSNIGIIANHISGNEERLKEKSVRIGIRIFFAANIAIVAALFVGNHISDKVKEKQLLQSAKAIASNNAKLFENIESVSISDTNVRKIKSTLGYIGKLNPKLNDPRLIFPCKYINTNSYCNIDSRSPLMNECNGIGKTSQSTPPDGNIDTVDFIYQAEEIYRSKIDEIMKNGSINPEIVMTKDIYKIFIPIEIGHKRCIIEFNKEPQFGRIGS